MNGSRERERESRELEDGTMGDRENRGVGSGKKTKIHCRDGWCADNVCSCLVSEPLTDV